MARLELPVRSFVESLARRAFPERDWSTGSALNDLVIKSFSVILQPFRHEIDVTKINQSLENYAYMREADLDALAANWGKTRQRGSRAEGSVRLYFDTAADYSFSLLEFVDDAGTVYTLTAPVTLTTAQLLANRKSDGTFYADVTAASAGLGDRYVVPAGAIRTLRNRPTNIVSVENIDSFRVTSPNETNYDVVNSLYRNVGLKNLVSRAAIRAPIYDTFPGVLDVFVAGSGHPKMLRDAQTVTVDGSNVTYHAGGAADVWVNTNNVQSREVILTYLPSSNTIDLVNADQALAREILYSFSQAFMTTDGIYTAPAHPDALDESKSIEFDYPLTVTVAKASVYNTWPTTGADLLGGSDLIVLPTGMQYVDSVGPSLAGTAAKVGDVISFETDQRRRITAKGGRTVTFAPEFVARVARTATAASPAGTRVLPLTGIGASLPRINEPVIITTGAAAGEYVVMATGTDSLIVGRPVSQVTLSNETVVTGGYRYDLAPTDVIPTHVDATFSVYSAPTPGDPGIDQTPSRWATVVEVIRTASTTQIVLNSTGFAGVVAVTGGLAGNVAIGDSVLLGTYKTTTAARSDVASPVLYADALAATFVAGSTSLSAPGIGMGALPGDLVVFDAVTGLTTDQSAATGGDGTKVTAVIEGATSLGSLQVYPLAFDVPAGTAYTVVRNREDIVSAANTTVTGPSVVYVTFPLGLGDAVGLVTVGPLKAVTVTLGGGNATITRDVTSLTALVAFPSGNLAPLFLGDSLVVTGAGALNGTYPVLSKDGTRVVVDASSNASFLTGTTATSNCAFKRRSAMPITASSNTQTRILKFVPPAKTIKLTMSSFGYQTAVVGQTVTQVYGATTYAGVLKAITVVGPNYVWEVAPTATGVDLFTTSVTAKVAATAVTGAYTPEGDSTWVYVGVSVAAAAIGDRATLVGGPYAGAYFIDAVDVAGSRVRIAASYPSAPAAGTLAVDTVPFVKTAIGTGRGLPTVRDDNAGSFYDYGYVSPSGVGGTVTQGSDTGILLAYDTGAYTWTVQTASPADTFTSLTIPVTLSASSATGTLQSPSTVDVSSFANITLTMPATPAFATGETVSFRSRFGLEGGLMDGNALRANPNIPAPFSTSWTDKTVLLHNGELVGKYPVSAFTTQSLRLTNPAAGELVRIANAPAPKPLTFGGPTITYALGTNTIVETDIGKWAGKGRIVQVRNANATYNFVVTQVNNANSVDVFSIYAVTISSASARWTYEVLEGFTAQYAVISNAEFKSYRAYAPPVLGDELHQSFTGATSSSINFSDPAADFGALLSDTSIAPGDFYLMIDSGADASATPYLIVANTTTTLTLATATSASQAGGVAYRIIRRPDPLYREGWFDGVITGATTVSLLSSRPAGFGTELDATIIIEPHPADPTGALVLPPLGASFVGSVLTFDTTPSSIGSWTSGVGFATSTIGRFVRVYFRTRDQYQSRLAAGQVLKTYNYYRQNEYMVSPIVKIQAVDQLDPATLQSVKSLTVELLDLNPGLRYGVQETLQLRILDSTDPFAPVRITYLTDPSIQAIEDYLTNEDTRILASSLMAKRMEVVSVDVSLQVRTESTSTTVANAIATYINTLGSTRQLTKVELLKYLFDQDVVSFVDLGSFSMGITYFRVPDAAGPSPPLVVGDVSEYYGADTASYLAGTITVTLL